MLWKLLNEVVLLLLLCFSFSHDVVIVFPYEIFCPCTLVVRMTVDLCAEAKMWCTKQLGASRVSQ